jgi:hypothetical protein
MEKRYRNILLLLLLLLLSHVMTIHLLMKTLTVEKQESAPALVLKTRLTSKSTPV